MQQGAGREPRTRLPAGASGPGILSDGSGGSPAGLRHYGDLNTPVERSEAESTSRAVQEAVKRFLPGASVTLAGGFRR